jgi:WD40 repeat protein
VVAEIALDADGDQVAVLSAGQIHIWERNADREPVRLSAWRCPALSPDGSLLAAIEATPGGEEPRVVVRDWRSGRCLVELEGLEPNVLLFPDNDTLLVGNQLGQVGRYDLVGRKWLRVLRGIEGHVGSVAFAPARQLVAGADESCVRLWQATDGKLLHEIALPAGAEAVVASWPRLTFSSDGERLGWASPAGLFLTWDCATGKQNGRLALPDTLFSAVLGFTAEGRCLAAGSTAIDEEEHDYQLRVWDLATGKQRFATEPQPYPVSPLVFTSDGRVLASGSWDRTVLLWDVAELVRT